ncbi:hypothetical protein [Lysinibacillus xylanilyticus]|uniref:hypothetical protein n=1 Tax=Lysinibacillus xylanilyticus TaxID=582475 RepID=UPI0036DC9C53
MKKLGLKILNLLTIAVILLSLGLPDLGIVKTAIASGTRMPGSSVMSLSTVSTDLQVPKTMTEVEGRIHVLEKMMDKIYPTAKGKNGLYWGRDLPFDLKDVATGKTYPGYCAQSYAYASKNMSAQGIVTDSRIIKLINTVTPANPESPSDAQQMAIQIVLWGALNNNWSPSLFSGGHVSTASSSYTGMTSVADHVQKIAANWSNIISSDTPNVKPIKIKNPEVQAICSPQKDGGAAEIDWTFLGGGQIAKLTDVADITYEGTAGGKIVHGSDPGVYTQLQKYGIKAKNSADYLIFDKPLNGEGGTTLTATVKYKKGYEALNNLQLAHYDGGSSNQPFIMPVKGKTKNFKISIKWNCPPDEKPPEEIPVEGGGDSIPLRWYNMPSAFGEIKNGIGYNESGITTTGKYAQTRSQETFEAMNGMPSTERFYVNLGGTEGFIDVEYSLENYKQDFAVQWQTPWEIKKTCGKAPDTYDCSESGTESFDKTFNWTFNAMHLKSASFRVFGDGQVRQPDLEMDLKIVNKDKEVGSYNVSPKAGGLEVGPGTGDSNYNIGATGSWAPSQGSFTTSKVTGRVATENDGKSQAYSQANGNVGSIFAQNDKLEITIKSKTYTFVPDVNKKTDQAYKDGGSYELDATNGQKASYFNPVKEKWDIWSHVPIAGYNGNPEDDGQRSLKGTPILLEDLPINILKGNGIYEFQTSEAGNVLDYESAVTTVKGGPKDLMDTVDELLDGTSKGKSTVYGNPKDPLEPEYYKDGNALWLQYTNWQVPTKSGENNLQFKHSGNKPDMNKDASLKDNPTYRSINPVLIHDPTTSLYSWVSDIPDSQLQDQRINASNDRITKHPSTQSGNARQYLDYDFQLTIPNVAAYETYWGQVAKNSKEAGFEDNDFTYPGTLGKGYKGSALGQINSRSYENPYSGASGWDVSKWTTAKYVKFPYDVFYYKNSGESGGDSAGFYEAGQWIKLYDDNHTVKVGDPTVFNFHVASEQKDVKDGIIYTASESLNAQDGLADNADALYRSAEQYVNGTRSVAGTNVGNYNTARDGEAVYSTANQINVDGIGRIGNVLVSDTSDPAWAGVFWQTKNGKVDTTKPVQKDYGTTFNFYDSNVMPNSTGFPGYDRFKSLTPWHGEFQPIHSLPLTTNVNTKGKEEQTVKLGYNIGGSLQTIGDYDYSMWIYPQNQLAGKFATGNAGQHFKLIASDPFMPGAKYQEYYDSSVNNTLHGSAGVLGKDYKPRYAHLLSSSLADPRMKMSGWEKKSTTYQKAVQLGASKKTLTGSPSWVVIPRSLRTLVGSDDSQGRWGPSGMNGNNSYGAKDAAGSADCPCSYENVQKWNWNYSLPQNTKIWFDQNPKNKAKDGTPKFESPSRDQYVITSMAFRTKVARNTFPGAQDMWQTSVEMPAIEFGNHYLVSKSQSIPDWDLTMYTNTGVNTLPDIQTSTKDVPKGITPSTDPSKPMTWDPTQEGNIGAPMLDIVWWNYSKSATTDKDNIGTH